MQPLTYKEVMKHETTLPEDFGGVFYFTNWTEEEFVGVWGKKEYHFAPLSTSPMIIPEHSPVEIQHIRKKFAKDLAEKYFFKTRNYEQLRAIEGVRDPATGMINPALGSSMRANSYNLDMLAPYIQKCLEPLPASKIKVTVKETETMEERLRINEDGRPVTGAIKSDADLSKLARE